MKVSKAIPALLSLTPLLLVFIEFFQWNLVDLLTPFLWLPLETFIFGATVVSLFVAAILVWWRGAWKVPRAYTPAILGIISLSAWAWFPFTNVWLDLNFSLLRPERELVAKSIFARSPINLSGQVNTYGVIDPSGYLRLPGAQGLLTMGGEVWVMKFASDKGVYFLTFEGILGQSSGYIFMDGNNAPVPNDYFHVAKKIAPHWYFAETE